jgi:hypothetical protein
MNFLLKRLPWATQRHRSQSMVRLAVCCEILECRRLLSMGIQPMGGADSVPTTSPREWTVQWADIAQTRGTAMSLGQEVSNLGDWSSNGSNAGEAVTSSPMGMVQSPGGFQIASATTATNTASSQEYSPFNTSSATSSGIATSRFPDGSSGSQGITAMNPGTATSTVPGGSSGLQGVTAPTLSIAMPSFPVGSAGPQGVTATTSGTATPTFAGDSPGPQGAPAIGSATTMPGFPVSWPGPPDAGPLLAFWNNSSDVTGDTNSSASSGSQSSSSTLSNTPS